MFADQTSGWWGGAGRERGRLTLLYLVRNNTLDVRTAALLWLLVEHKASILVGAGPRLAGKTTLLTAIMDMAPPWYELVQTRGRYEDFSFLQTTTPEKTYILVPELSDHTPAYLWGAGVLTIFQAMARGYSLAATMHADTPMEVMHQLQQHPVGLPRQLMHHLHVIVNLHVDNGLSDVVRRVRRVSLTMPGPAFLSLMEWDHATDSFLHRDSGEVRKALAEHLGAYGTDLHLGQRIEAFQGWLRRRATPDEFRELIVQHYQAVP